jgi:hypothetical protein
MGRVFTSGVIFTVTSIYIRNELFKNKNQTDAAPSYNKDVFSEFVSDFILNIKTKFPR